MRRTYREEPPYEPVGFRRETDEAGPLIRCDACDFLGSARALRTWNDRAGIDSLDYECPRCRSDDTSGMLTPFPDGMTACTHCNNAIALTGDDLCFLCNKELRED